MNAQAIILAAGVSRRLKELTHHTPKSLLPLADSCLLERHLKSCARLGFKKVYIAVGFRKELIIERFGNVFAGVDISYIHIEDFETAGHSSTLRKVLSIVEPLDLDFLLMHADLICDQRIYALMASCKDSCLAIDANSNIKTNDECLVKWTEVGMVEKIYFGPDKNQIHHSEYMGMAYLTNDFVKAFSRHLNHFVETYGCTFSYEEVLNDFIESRVSAVSLFARTFVSSWVNVNYIEDLETARNLLKEGSIT